MHFLLSLFLISSAHAATILMLGDSLTEGYGVAQEEAFPALVENELKKKDPNLHVINAGIGASTTASGLARLRWSLQSKPEILFLCLGANDGLRGVALAETKKNLREILDLAKEHKLKVLLAGMQLPLNYGQKYRNQFEAMYTELAKTYKLKFIPFLLEGVAAKPKLNQADGIHPNREGHKIIAKTVLRALEPMVFQK